METYPHFQTFIFHIKSKHKEYDFYKEAMIPPHWNFPASVFREDDIKGNYI